MTIHSAIEEPSQTNKWQVITQAVIGGFVIWNTMLWFAIEIDEYPFGAAAPVAWVTAVGVMSYLLLRQDFLSGYVLSILTGVFGLFSIGLILAGPHGPPPGEPASPALFVVFGPGAYVTVAVILMISSYLAWRQRSEIRETDSPKQAEI